MTYNNPLYSFESAENDRVLIFTWTDTTKNMTDEDFQEALHNYAGFAFELKGPGLIVDVRNFYYKLSDEMMTWRNDECLPRYLAAGSTRMAYILPEGALANMPEGDVVIGKFTDRYFSNLDDAKKWLLQ